MLPNPSKVFIKAVNEEIFKYIWNDKPDRIKRVKFIQNYESGGVKMTDVESHINARRSFHIMDVPPRRANLESAIGEAVVVPSTYHYCFYKCLKKKKKHHPFLAIVYFQTGCRSKYKSRV